MDIQKLVEQVKKAWTQGHWSPQTAAIGLTVVLCLLAVTLVQRRTADNADEQLFTECPLTPAEMQRVEAALANSGLERYSLQDGVLWVPQGQRGRFLAAIQDADCLPQTFQTPTDLSTATSIFETARQRDERAHRAREQKARLAIRSLRGIEDAFVFFDEVPSGSLRLEKRTTAAVGVKTQDGKPLGLNDFQMIQDMVLHLDANLKPSEITVHDLGSGEWVKGPVDNLQGHQKEMLMRRSLEIKWNDQIRDVLSFLPSAKIHVTVVPDDRFETASSVNVSISVPSSYLDQFALMTSTSNPADRAHALRDKIQSAVKPLLPQRSTTVEDHVVVHFVDVRQNVAELPASWWTLVRNPIFATLLVGALLVISLIFFVSGNRSTDPDPTPNLRVFSSEDPSSPNLQHDQTSTAKLRAYVEGDPEAAAQSLSEFIDRAS